MSYFVSEKTNREHLIKGNREFAMETADGGLFLSQMFSSIPIPTFAIDRKHKVVHWNSALEKLTGLSAAEMVGTNHYWKAFYSSRKPVLADLVMGNAAQELVASFYEGKYRKSSLVESGYEAEDFFPSMGKWLLITATPITDTNGNLLGAVETLTDITETKKMEGSLRESERRYKELSITDSLTKFYNSRKFFRQLIQETQRANRYRHPLSLMLLDIDNFKGFNDTFGHAEGDKALKVLATVTRKALRRTDTAFRYGGEEFMIILPETRGEDAKDVAERIRKNFENSVVSASPQLKARLTVSIGVTGYVSEEEIATFLKRADSAMIEAKKKGKNQVCLEA